MPEIRQTIREAFAQIRIYPDPTEFRRVIGAVNKVRRAVIREADRLPFRCANEFRMLVISNILSQKHTEGYAPYSEKYGEWKEKTIGHTDFWRLFNNLIKNISVMRLPARGYTYRYLSGIQPGVYDQGGTSMYGGKGRPVLISVYGRWMEFGRRGQPARPMFEPTHNEYQSEGWPQQVNRTSTMVKGAWS